MFSKYHFVVILIALSKSCGVYTSDYNFNEDVNEGNWLEVKIAALLAQMETKTNHKLDAIDKKIPENLEEALNRKVEAMNKKILEKLDETKMQLDILEKKIPERLETSLENNFIKLDRKYHASQEDIREIIHKLETNLLVKLEEYVDDKLNSLEKHINRKIYALEKIVADKTDTGLINHKLSVLEKLQIESDGGAICTLANKTSKQIEENLNQKLDIIEKTILHLENTTTGFNFDVFDKYSTKLENKINEKMAELKKMVPDMEENIKNKLDAMGKQVSEHFEQNIKLKLDTVQNKMINIGENIQHNMETWDKRFEQNINHKLDEMQTNVPKIEQNIYNRMDTLLNLEKNVLTELNETRYGLGCKEQIYTGTEYVEPYLRINDDSLKHVTFKNDSDGLSYFEMHLAVKSSRSVHILLLPEAITTNYYLDHNAVFEIGFFAPKQIILFKTRKSVANANTPDIILSTTRFTPFYIKINNGTLEIGKEGSSSPLISYSDEELKKLNYFSFGSAEKHSVKTVLYDCPSNLFQLIFNQP